MAQIHKTCNPSYSANLAEHILVRRITTTSITMVTIIATIHTAMG